MSNPDEQPTSAINGALFALGVLLLLPGVCTVFYAAQAIAEGDFIRLATRDPYFQSCSTCGASAWSSRSAVPFWSGTRCAAAAPPAG